MPYVRSPGGICPLCLGRAATLEEHHVCYDPEKKIRICHLCHFKIHHQSWMLSTAAQLLLEKLKGCDCKKF